MKQLLILSLLLFLEISSQAQLKHTSTFTVPFDMYRPNKEAQYNPKVIHSIVALSAVMILASYANHTGNKDLHQISKGLFLGVSIAVPIYIFKEKKHKYKYY